MITRALIEQLHVVISRQVGDENLSPDLRIYWIQFMAS
jgi:hypothetical protein